MNKFLATTLLLGAISTSPAYAFSFGPDMNWGPNMNWGSSPSWSTPNMNWGNGPGWNGGPTMNWGNNTPWGGTPFGFGNNSFPSWGNNNGWSNWPSFQMPSFNWQNGPNWNNGSNYGMVPGMVYQQPFPGYTFQQQPRFAPPQTPAAVMVPMTIAPTMRPPVPPVPATPAAPATAATMMTPPAAPARIAAPAPIVAAPPAGHTGTGPVFPSPTEVPADETPATPEAAATTSN